MNQGKKSPSKISIPKTVFSFSIAQQWLKIDSPWEQVTVEWIGTTQKGRSRTVTHRRRCRRCGRACRRIAKMSKRRIKYPSQKNVLNWKRKWVSPGAKVTGRNHTEKRDIVWRYDSFVVDVPAILLIYLLRFARYIPVNELGKHKLICWYIVCIDC